MKQNEVIKLLQNVIPDCNLTLSQNPILKKKELDFGFNTQVAFESGLADILIGFSEEFPKYKPEYFLLPYDHFGRIPHIEEDGYICYTHDETTVLDVSNPEGVIAYTLDAVKKTIIKGIKGENKADFINEFEAYWSRLRTKDGIAALLQPNESAIEIKIGVNEKFTCAFHDSIEGHNWINKLKSIRQANFQVQNGIYIPLKHGSNLLPPLSSHIFNLNEIYNIIWQNISEANKKFLKKALSSPCKKTEYLVLTLPQPNGNYAYFGVKFSQIVSNVNPIIDVNANCKITPLVITRYDKPYLSARGGIGFSYNDKRGLIIGCGAVGSRVIEELVKMGFENLTICDKDIFKPENLYRHVLGITQIGVNKSLAIKKKLEDDYFYSTINAYNENIETLLKKKTLHLNQFDFIVVATGNPTINICLMESLKKLKIKAPTFFCWNDPYGIGGHCLACNIEGMGCYNCLYSNDELQNNASFASKNQEKDFSKSISGCGSVYIPYSSLDAMETAILTVRILIKYLNGEIKRNEIYSWKGDPVHFLNEKYFLSSRFNQTEEELMKNKANFYSEHCRICNLI